MYSHYPFSPAEIAQLEAKGFSVAAGTTHLATDGGFRRIIKREQALFEVQSWMDDGSGQGPWAYDSEYTDLALAIARAL